MLCCVEDLCTSLHTRQNVIDSLWLRHSGMMLGRRQFLGVHTERSSPVEAQPMGIASLFKGQDDHELACLRRACLDNRMQRANICTGCLDARKYVHVLRGEIFKDDFAVECASYLANDDSKLLIRNGEKDRVSLSDCFQRRGSVWNLRIHMDDLLEQWFKRRADVGPKFYFGSKDSEC